MHLSSHKYKKLEASKYLGKVAVYVKGDLSDLRIVYVSLTQDGP